MRRIASATAFLLASSAAVLLVDAGCAGDDPAAPGPKPEAGSADDGPATSADAGGPDGSWSFKTYECPAPSGGFPAGTDKWSPLVQLKRPSDGLDIPPIHIILLANGRVLMPGANLRATPEAGIIAATSNFILTPDEPAADKVLMMQEIGSPHLGAGESLFCSGHAHLEDGRVFLAGGNKEGVYCPDAGGADAAPPCVDGNFGLDYAEIFDPATESFSIVEQKMLGGKRWYPTVTRLPDGKIIVTAGDAVAEFERNHSIETFDPQTSSWTILSDEGHTPKEVEIHAHYVHVYVLPRPVDFEAKSRDAVVMGEYGHMFLLSTAVSHGNSLGRWAQRTSRPGPVSEDIIKANGATSVMLPLVPRNEGRFNQGSILVIGGSEDPALQKAAEVYDPYLDKWCPAFAPLEIPRFQASTVLLPDGNVLLIAGSSFPTTYTENAPQRAPQILDPRTGAVWTGSPWPDPYTRGYHSTTLLLPDGRVIIAGGRTFSGGDPDLTNNWDERTDLRYYYPPYFTPIFAGKPRPAIDAVPAEPIRHGAPMEIGYSAGPIDMVALVALGSQTHCVDMNARHIQLDFTGGTAENGTVTLYGPLDKAAAAPGKYMLFLLHKIDGWLVPSIAKIVSVQ